APPVHHHVELLFFLSRHGRDLRLGGRIDGLRRRSKSKGQQQNAGRPINRSHCRIPARISVSSVRRRCRHKWTAPSNPSAADRLRVGRDDGLSAGSENSNRQRLVTPSCQTAEQAWSTCPLRALSLY